MGRQPPVGRTLLDALEEAPKAEQAAAQPGMIYIPGGTFQMGSDNHYPEEAPVHRVAVDGFWIDRTPVTNRQFKEFVKATGYVTVAEQVPDAKDYPGALPHMLYAGSLVFQKSSGPVDLRNPGMWWAFVQGANWRHPLGPKQRPVQEGKPPGRAHRLCRRTGLCALGRQGPADRSRVGICGLRRPGRGRICVGPRVRARRQADGQYLAGRVPAPESADRRL